MKLTTKGRFAVTAMLDVALNSSTNAVNLTSISQRQQISLSYLEQLFTRLRRAGLVTSTRGPGGGYTLGKRQEDINIAQIIKAAEDTMDATMCSGKSNCKEGTACLTHHLWTGLSHTIDDYLSGISLADMVNKQPTQHTHHPVSIKLNYNKDSRTHDHEH